MKYETYEYLGIEKFDGENSLVRFRRHGTYDRALKITVKELFAVRKDIIKQIDGEIAAGLGKLLEQNTKVVIHEPKYVFKYLLIISALFLGCINAANFLYAYFLNFFGVNIAFGGILFTTSFILNTTIAEVYGFKNARAVLWASVITSLFSCLVLVLCSWFLVDSNGNQKAISINLWAIIASITAYFIADYYNNKILIKLKNSSKPFWYRVFTSNMFAHLIDTIVFIFLSQFFVLGVNEMLYMFYRVMLAKSCKEIIVIPVVILLSDFLKKLEGIQRVDDGATKLSLLNIEASYDLNSIFLENKQSYSKT